MRRTRFTKAELLTTGVIILLFFLFLEPAIHRWRNPPSASNLCNMNLRALGSALLRYAKDNDNRYPVVHQWCDLLLEGGYATEDQFKCPGNAGARCGYAMNPYCDINSPPDTVLLFDATGGWNQSGSSEVLHASHYEGLCVNILSNDGHVRSMKTTQLPNLNWGCRMEDAVPDEP